MKRSTRRISLIMALVMMLSLFTFTTASAADGVLDVGMSIAIDSMTPFRANTGRDQYVLKLVYEQLGVFDENQVLQPWGAKGWTTEDNLNYQVEIWDNIYDSAGNHITADDVVWFITESKTRALKPCFAKVEKVEKTGDYTLAITMNQDQIGAFDTMCSDVFMVSKAAFEASADEFATSPVTTSIYALTGFQAGSTYTFAMRDNYWQAKENLPACVQFIVPNVCYHTITEASQMGIALETGVIDVAVQMDLTTAVQYVDNSAYTVEQVPGNQGWTLFFSGAESRNISSDVNLCRAICSAIWNEGLIQGLCSGYGVVMSDVCSPRHIGHNPEWDTNLYYEYSVDKAKEYLAQSNYHGEELVLLTGSSTLVSRMAQMIQAFCLQVGINIKINSVDMAQLTAIRLDGNQYDMFINTIGGTYCADHWAIRYDPNAYELGDGTARKDYTLGDMLYKTWTVSGYTQENIDAVHDYILTNGIAYGLIDPTTMCVWRNNCGLENEVKEFAGYINPACSTWSGL
ncbi:MAG: ABC transporter substrate-binding protein [Clostridia bacterium]|nr:ABC transporter substrate-binding protein [Clostridia bacterium]